MFSLEYEQWVLNGLSWHRWITGTFKEMAFKWADMSHAVQFNNFICFALTQACIALFSATTKYAQCPAKTLSTALFFISQYTVFQETYKPRHQKTLLKFFCNLIGIPLRLIPCLVGRNSSHSHGYQERQKRWVFGIFWSDYHHQMVPG